MIFHARQYVMLHAS